MGKLHIAQTGFSDAAAGLSLHRLRKALQLFSRFSGKGIESGIEEQVFAHVLA